MVLTSGCFLETDLTEIQCDVSDVTQQYRGLGAALRERQQQLSAMLEAMQEVQEEASSMLKWLESKERTLSELDASSSPTKTETMRAQAEHNKVNSLPEHKNGDLSVSSQRSSEMGFIAAGLGLTARICPGFKQGFAQGSQAGSGSRSPALCSAALLLDLLLSGVWLGGRRLSAAHVAGSLQLLLESSSQPGLALGAKLAHDTANKMK